MEEKDEVVFEKFKSPVLCDYTSTIILPYLRCREIILGINKNT